MNQLAKEYRHFLSHPWDVRVLLVANMVYAFVLPVIEIFVAAYIMRNSRVVSLVVTYQLTVYSGIPFTFLLNGFLLKHVRISALYSLGMMLSGMSMLVMTFVPQLDRLGIAAAGLLMGVAQGFFWANRGFLALSTTRDENRNYFYGLETAFYTITFVVVPPVIGWFIESAGMGAQSAYRVVTGCVFALTVLASAVVNRGRFANPVRSRFVFFRFHPLWRKLLALALLKGLAQGYIVTAPAMLIMKMLGEEGALGTLQSAGAIVSSLVLYGIGRLAKPSDRIFVLATGLGLFTLGAVFNAALFNASGVLLFMLCLLLARPLLDVAYFPIQMRVIDLVSAIEGRNQFAYIVNHEFGLYAGRLLGCGLFIAMAVYGSDVLALRYALAVIGALQLLSIWVARSILRDPVSAAEDSRANVTDVTDVMEVKL